MGHACRRLQANAALIGIIATAAVTLGQFERTWSGCKKGLWPCPRRRDSQSCRSERCRRARHPCHYCLRIALPGERAAWQSADFCNRSGRNRLSEMTAPGTLRSPRSNTCKHQAHGLVRVLQAKGFQPHDQGIKRVRRVGVFNPCFATQADQIGHAAGVHAGNSLCHIR